MNKIIKCLYIIMLSTIFTNNTISMQQQANIVIKQEKSQLLNLPSELALHIINQALLSQIKKAINNSYNDIFNEHATIKFNLNEIKGFRDSSKYLYDLINNHLKSESCKKIINDLKQERFDELLESLKEQSKKEYKEWSIQDLNKALVDIVNEGY